MAQTRGLCGPVKMPQMSRDRHTAPCSSVIGSGLGSTVYCLQLHTAARNMHGFAEEVVNCRWKGNIALKSTKHF